MEWALYPGTAKPSHRLAKDPDSHYLMVLCLRLQKLIEQRAVLSLPSSSSYLSFTIDISEVWHQDQDHPVEGTLPSHLARFALLDYRVSHV